MGIISEQFTFFWTSKKVVKIHLLRKPKKSREDTFTWKLKKKVAKIQLRGSLKKSREDSVTWKLKKNRPPKYARFLIKNIHFATPAILTGRTFV